MKRKIPIAILGVLLVVLMVITFAFFGCKPSEAADVEATEEVAAEESAQEDASTESAATEEEVVAETSLNFGITNPSTYEWYTNAVQGFTDYCTENNIEVTYLQTQEAQSALEQVDHVDQMIASDLDAIGIIVSDGDVLVSAVEACKEAGIPVGTPGAEVNIEKFSPNDVDVRIVGGNYGPAYDLGIYMGEVLGGEGNVVIVYGVPGIGVADDRDAGVNDGLAEYSGITVLDDQPGNWDPEISYNVVSDFLTKYDKIDAVFGGFDGGALAAYQAAEAVGRESEMKFFGFDGAVAAFESIAKNELQATVDMNSYNLGYLLARDLHRAVTYSKFQQTYLEVNYEIVTRDNLLEYAPEYADMYVE